MDESVMNVVLVPSDRDFDEWTVWAVSVLYKVKVALAASTRHHHHQIQQTNKSKDDEAEKSLFSLIKD
jgi:hypothetical protein